MKNKLGKCKSTRETELSAISAAALSTVVLARIPFPAQQRTLTWTKTTNTKPKEEQGQKLVSSDAGGEGVQMEGLTNYMGAPLVVTLGLSENLI